MNPIRVQVITAFDDLQFKDCLAIKDLINGFIRNNLVCVVINLKAAKHIPLAGILMLAERRKRLREYGGDLILCCLSKHMKSLFSLQGYEESRRIVKSSFQIAETEDEASAAFGKLT
jgi:anti-anti-sigma factor